MITSEEAIYKGDFLISMIYVSGFYILIKVEREKFKGYDYESGAYCMGEVRGNEIRIYDYEKSDYFRYKIY